MLKLWLIRHGKTEGNKLGRYIGVTDEPLCEEGKEFLEKMNYPLTGNIYVSPMKRCLETAQILFPGKSFLIIDELSECNFGDFENKNYKELTDNPDYQKWVDSGCELPIPNGESREEFKRRSLTGFQKAVSGCIRNNIAEAALVIHGGTIMNIMESYADRARPFYEWHVKNGGGYEIEIDTDLWKRDKREVILLSSILEG